MLEYCYKGCIPEVKKKITDMAINGSGIWDTVRVLNVSKGTVIKVLKSKEACLIQVSPNLRPWDSTLKARSALSLGVIWQRLMSNGHS